MKSFFETDDGYSYGSDNNEEGNHDPDSTNCYTDKENENRNEMDPDSNENLTNSAEDGPSVNQPGSGYHQTPNPSEPRKNGNPNNKGNKNKGGNTNSGAGNHSDSSGGGKGHQGPTHGQPASGWYNIKKVYNNWCDKVLKISHPKHQYDCLLGVLPDRLGLYRPALVFAVGLGEVTNWSINPQILQWSENLIRLFGLGIL